MTSSNTKRKKRTKRNYFTQETEDAIVLYNKIPDDEERNKIYQELIHPAFFKLTENIIHTFKFYHTEVEFITDLQQEVIIFLLSKIHLFDQTKGFKAYSYFGTITKRWLILNNDKIYKKKIVTHPIENIQEDEKHSYNMNDMELPRDKLSFFMDKYIEYCTENIHTLFPKDKDSKIADAILELFRKRENITLFNKKALYIYIREIVDVKTLKITQIANKLHTIFKKNYQFYNDNNYILFQNNIYNQKNGKS